jgi:hypothetical protein
MPLDEAYRKTYKLRLAQANRFKSIEVTFPYEVVDKEARKRGITVEEFIKLFQVVAQFNGFDGVMYHFEEIKSNNDDSK